MHVIPADTPVRGQAAFFDPDTPQSSKADWSYRALDGRRHVDFGSMSFAHCDEITRADLASQT